MKDARLPARSPDATYDHPRRRLARSGDATGLQAGQVATIRQAEGLRDVLGPEQWAVYIDLTYRWFARERRRLLGTRWLRDAA